MNYQLNAIPLAEDEKFFKMQPPTDADFHLRKRYFVIGLSFVGCVVLIILRINLSLCLVDMTSNKTVVIGNATYIQEPEFKWSSSEKGLILSSFSWGYLTTPLTVVLVNRLGSGNAYNFSIFMTGILTILSPFLIRCGILIYLGGRFLEGVFEGLAISASYGIFSEWIPSKERSRLINLSAIGRPVGSLIGYPLSGLIGFLLSWEYIFYITGSTAILWVLIWTLTVRGPPSTDVWITKTEKSYLETVNETIHRKNVTYPWRSIITSKPILAFLNEIFVDSWSVSFLMFCFPLYIKDMHDVSIDKIGIFAAIPQFSEILSRLLGSWYQDHLRTKGKMSNTKIHKIYIMFAQVSAIILLVLIGLLSEFYCSLIILCLFKMCFTLAELSYSVLPVDMAPHFSPTIEALKIVCFSIGYLLNPIVMGVMVSNHTNSEWSHYFWFLCLFNLWGLSIFSYYGSAEPQPWAYIDKKFDREASSSHTIG